MKSDCILFYFVSERKGKNQKITLVMAEKNKDVNVGVEEGQDKTPNPLAKDDANVADGKSMEAETEAPDSKDIDDALMILNVMDKEVGGKGEIPEIPETMRGSIKYLIEKLVFVRDLFEDPQWKAIADDMADQKEDGETPSVAVAVARTFSLEEIQELADNEDYKGAQEELTKNLSAKKQTEQEDAEYEENFKMSQKAGEEYAAEMGYSEEEQSELFNFMLDMYKILGDGKLTKEEWAKADKMRNYDKDTSELRSQIEEAGTKKEVLPDKASVDSAIQTKPKKQMGPSDSPGIGSMSAYNNTGVDVTQIGKRKRQGGY